MSLCSCSYFPLSICSNGGFCVYWEFSLGVFSISSCLLFLQRQWWVTASDCFARYQTTLDGLCGQYNLDFLFLPEHLHVPILGRIDMEAQVIFFLNVRLEMDWIVASPNKKAYPCENIRGECNQIER